MSKQLGPASPKQEMILNCDAQITVIGGAAGSGKSYLLQLLPLRYIDDKNTNCIMFRRTTVQLRGQGGIFDTAKDIYMSLPKRHQPKFKEAVMESVFPNGAKVKWQHMETVKDKYNIQGLIHSPFVVRTSKQTC